MIFADKYTTTEKIDVDQTGLEAKKTIISNDAYAISDMIEKLINKFSQMENKAK